MAYTQHPFKHSPSDMILEILSVFSCHCALVTGTSKGDKVDRKSISVVVFLKPSVEKAPFLAVVAKQTRRVQAGVQQQEWQIEVQPTTSFSLSVGSTCLLDRFLGFFYWLTGIMFGCDLQVLWR